MPTPSWSTLREPFGIGTRWMAPAIRIARAPSGQAASTGSLAISCAATPDTTGVATLVPLAARPFAVRTLTAGATRFGLL